MECKTYFILFELFKKKRVDFTFESSPGGVILIFYYYRECFYRELPNREFSKIIIDMDIDMDTSEAHSV